jgi:hypothetical protein
MERGEAMGKPGGAAASRPHRGYPSPWPIRFPGLPLLPRPLPRSGRGRHLRAVPQTGKGDTPWDRLSVVELRALLRDYPIDRTSLPAPIENMRRAELIEALRQIGAMGFGGEGV